jgi:hypothetical protein
MTEPEPEPARSPGTPEEAAAPETPEEKRARIMRRLAEMIREEPPDIAGAGPVSAGGFPMLPTGGDEFDQESAAKLFAALGEFFQRRKPGDSQDLETE